MLSAEARQREAERGPRDSDRAVAVRDLQEGYGLTRAEAQEVYSDRTQTRLYDIQQSAVDSLIKSKKVSDGDVVTTKGQRFIIENGKAKRL